MKQKIKQFLFVLLDIVIFLWVIKNIISVYKSWEALFFGFFFGGLISSLIAVWYFSAYKNKELQLKYKIFFQNKIVPGVRIILILITFSFSKIFGGDIVNQITEIFTKGTDINKDPFIILYIIFTTIMLFISTGGICLGIKNLFKKDNINKN